MRETTPIERENGEGPTDGDSVIERHPSFAMAGISQRSGRTRLFGSSINHNNTITLTPFAVTPR